MQVYEVALSFLCFPSSSTLFGGCDVGVSKKGFQGIQEWKWREKHSKIRYTPFAWVGLLLSLSTSFSFFSGPIYRRLYGSHALRTSMYVSSYVSSYTMCLRMEANRSEASVVHVPFTLRVQLVVNECFVSDPYTCVPQAGGPARNKTARSGDSLGRSRFMPAQCWHCLASQVCSDSLCCHRQLHTTSVCTR
jgi:hypothetical protein